VRFVLPLVCLKVLLEVTAECTLVHFLGDALAGVVNNFWFD